MQFILPENVSEIIGSLEAAGFEAYAVGGCVRDLLLGLTPKDWDLTTSAEPLQIKEIFKKTVDTGIKHGTVTVIMGGRGYEVTTYRIDGKYEDSRHPKDVTFTKSLEQDLLRRDFTINAMAYNEKSGLVDCFGGKKDLEDGIIRCVGNANARFNEDALRILRAYRFAARFGFEIEEETRIAATELREKLKNVSAERIREEITKTLVSENPAELIKMHEAGILQVAVPALVPFFEREDASAILEEVKLALKAAPLSDKDKVAFAYGVLGGFAAKAENDEPLGYTRGLLRYLKFDNDTTRMAAGLAANLDRERASDEESVRRAMNIMGDRLFDLWVVYINECGNRDGAAVAGSAAAIRERGDCVKLKQLAITGKDLIDAGTEQGETVGNCLDFLLDRVLADPSLNSAETLLKLAGEFRANEE